MRQINVGNGFEAASDALRQIKRPDLMTALNGSDDTPTAEEIRSAVEHIVAGPGFRRSPQLVAFLRYLVESVLCGRAEHIKSYTIGVEALKRGERFDPQTDPFVRVEAARLRKALASSFAREGADLPVTIEIPLGGYVPVFRRRNNYRSITNLIAILMRALRGARVPSQANHLLFFPLRRPPRKRPAGGLGRSSSG
jgi:hypothetical protein